MEELYLIKKSTLTNIANAMRESAPDYIGDGELSPEDMASRMRDVYDNGSDDGYISAYDAINPEVTTQADLIAQIKAKANSLPSASSSGTSGNVFFGTVTSNASGIVTIPMPSFEPKQMMLWNVSVVEQDIREYFVRYLCDGIMLCAVWSSEYGGWVAQYMFSQSGSVAIAQASADSRGAFQGFGQDYGSTNIYSNADSIVWQLGGDSNENGINDFTEVTFNYVITG